ncbi:arylsulfatase [Novosphingobium mathurense]|uniref:Arylsulfatase n=1 Tax=Novosphingobium mathurense TaxID=428990 RepID=A0A1U6ILG2_9SPHN|nr:arylsulfatase [Novosphingobium mathurense]SLK08846.1 arylsulfatase [Novosphingobium mathurense]
MKRQLSLLAAVVLAAVPVISSSADAKTAQAPARPNVIVILADDLSYSDLGTYGGEISTPNLDALAKRGLAFTAFHTTPMCSPSRAELLTGEDQHRTGFGTMAEFLTDNQRGQPGYELLLNERVSTIPERLKPFGYNSFMSGKWHLGRGALPPQRGFDRSFYLIQGAANHFINKGYAKHMATVQYEEDGKPFTLPSGFYSSDFYTSRMIDYIEEGRKLGKPFFGYLAYTAPHFPLQAPEALIAKYEPVYAAGWDALRSKRFERQKELGLVPSDASAPPARERVPAWSSLSLEQQRYQTKIMATYAAMIEDLDTNVGRLVAYLKKTGQYDNTLILFTSDNGPEALDLNHDYFLPNVTDWLEENYDNSYESVGSANSFVFLGEGWASAVASAHRLFKDYVTEGGIRGPLIVSWPAAQKRVGFTDMPSTLLDILPTAVDAADGEALEQHAASPARPDSQGISLLPYITGRSEVIARPFDGTGFELFGNEAFVSGDWKILKLRAPEGDGTWKLYNVAWDPAESHDLAAEYPVRFAALKAAYQAYATHNGVVSPPDDFRIVPTGGKRAETSNPTAKP